ncbi:MAG: ParB/RepB/Spo0J family partition protein [Anaerolineales bacterium]|nr:MAG: ParB/RepB/Spo0J family partition protein [Anaerolineales bacterium]
MAQQRRGLGKGLGALIPATEVSGPGLSEVAVDLIVPNPMQPRQVLDAEALQELADSIREHGLIQPLIVTSIQDPASDAQYQIIVGERRWEAAKIVGLTRVPVIVKEATPQEMLELALVENIQRADLNPLEEAAAYRQLLDDFGLTQGQVAEKVGKSRVTVANSVRLLRLPDEIKQVLAEGQISEGHARALLALNKRADQLKVLEAIVKKGLSVRQTEEMVRRVAAGTQPKRRGELPSPETKALENEFRNVLGTKVRLFRSKKGGKLVIQFYSEEELEAIYRIIVGGDRGG